MLGLICEMKQYKFSQGSNFPHYFYEESRIISPEVNLKSCKFGNIQQMLWTMMERNIKKHNLHPYKQKGRRY